MVDDGKCKGENIIAEMVTSRNGEEPEVHGFNLYRNRKGKCKIEYLGKARNEISGNIDTSELKCGLEAIHSVEYGKDYDCEYSGDIDCDECLINGGFYDPRYPREDQEPKLIPTVSNEGINRIGYEPENLENVVTGMGREIDELKRKVKVMEKNLNETIELCHDMVTNLEKLWKR